MKINIVCVGKIKEQYWADAIIEYQKRIKKFCEINILEVKDEPNKNGIDCKKIEGERILENLPQGYNIVLAINGKELDSIAFSEKISEIFDLRPAKIIEKFQLKKPIYEPTASYGHVGRKPYKDFVTVIRHGKKSQELVQFFGWELLDAVDDVRKAFGL